jgi:hypothetical protein
MMSSESLDPNFSLLWIRLALVISSHLISNHLMWPHFDDESYEIAKIFARYGAYFVFSSLEEIMVLS